MLKSKNDLNHKELESPQVSRNENYKLTKLTPSNSK